MGKRQPKMDGHGGEVMGNHRVEKRGGTTEGGEGCKTNRHKMRNGRRVWRKDSG